MTRARPEVFTPRSISVWSLLCIQELPAAARQLFLEANAAGDFIDPADAFLAAIEEKSESQARAAARRQYVKGWGAGARAGDEEEKEPAEPLAHPGLGEWVEKLDPATARAALEIRAAVEACAATTALEMLGLADLAADSEIVGRVRQEMREWDRLAERDEVDVAEIARRDGVTRRMVQIALKGKSDLIGRGQMDLFGGASNEN